VGFAVAEEADSVPGEGEEEGVEGLGDAFRGLSDGE
jgi:hypothetical protein